MNVEIMLTRLMARQRNLYIHAYPNYQALFRVLAAVRSIGLQNSGTDGRTSTFRKPTVGPHNFGVLQSDLESLRI